MKDMTVYDIIVRISHEWKLHGRGRLKRKDNIEMKLQNVIYSKAESRQAAILGPYYYDDKVFSFLTK